MADKDMTGKGEPVGDGAKDFHKPYRMRPVEVYAEPNPDVCTKDKTS